MALNTNVDTAELLRALQHCRSTLEGCVDGEPDWAAIEAALGGLDRPQWRQLLTALPPGVEQIISTIKPPLQVIVAVLQVIKALLSIVKAILLGLPDPFRALIQAAHDLLADIINDLLNTGAYMYFDAPGITSPPVSLVEMGLSIDSPAEFKHGRDLTAPTPPPSHDQYAAWSTRFRRSFDDPGDDERPMVTSGAPIQAVFIVAAAPSFTAIRQAIYLLGRLFNIDAFKQAWEKYLEGSEDPRKSRAEVDSVAPDWSAARLVDLFPPLRELLIIPEALLALLAAVDNIIGLLDSLASAIQEKIALLEELAAAVQAIIDLLDALKTAGLYMLPVSSTDGIDGLVRGFVNAENRPPGGYVAGMCFLASGPNLAKAQLLFEIFGAGAGDFDEFVETPLGQAVMNVADIYEDSKEKAIAEADAFQDTVREEADAFVDALMDLELPDLESLGLSPEQMVALADELRSVAVDQIADTLETYGIDDERLTEALANTKGAQRYGHRSLALGFGVPKVKS